MRPADFIVGSTCLRLPKENITILSTTLDGTTDWGR